MDRSTTLLDIYVYPEQAWSTLDLSGFDVEATDGRVGKVDGSTYEIGADALIIDTGPWIFGERIMLPTGVISRIDADEHRMWVNLTKDEIHEAPRFDENRWREPAYRDEVGTYYMGRLNRPAGPDFGMDDRSDIR